MNLGLDYDTVTQDYDVARLVRAVNRAGGVHLRGEPAPEAWDEWVKALFPRHAVYPFGDHHAEFWEWVWAIERESSPHPFVAIWPRGGAKTTSAELGCTALGVRDKRRYAWYVNETQDKADKNVENIAALLESRSVEKHYPSHAQRKVGKFGQSKGWRRNRVRTAGGFTVDALGLDTAQRGLKVEEQRPDLIILDDVDGKLDSPATIAKKIAIITTSILPAGSSNVAVLAVQNLITPDGVFSRFADGRADFLVDRIVSGPHPAVVGLEWETNADGEYVITGGVPTWEGQDLEICQNMIGRMGLTAFLKECQHMVKELAEGIALKYDAVRHTSHWTDEEIVNAVGLGRLRPFAGIDFGHWRFAFLLLASDEDGRIHVLDELFSQREDLTTRAKAIHAICQKYGIGKLPIWGDSANPTDIAELNHAWRRGWDDEDGWEVRPDLVVVPVLAEGKARSTSVERLNDLLARDALLFRATLGRDARWNLGMNAAGDGSQQIGSRTMWEVRHWSYPGPQEGKAQKQDPDDDTADGGDAVAALRYGTMSWLVKAKPEDEKVLPLTNYDPKYERVVELLTESRQRKRRAF